MKRIFDFVVALCTMLILLPIMIIISVIIYFQLGTPILFTQDRPGLNSKVFKMFKFRSMCDSNDEHGNPLPDSERLTSFGKFLRASSLDELPGLWNVLKGDISLVGPRPLLVEYLPLYSSEEARRHEVQPGITGWAQVNGRNALSWKDKFKYDVWYVDNQSFWLDLKILLLTIKKVLIREGISASEHVTMPLFTGSENKKTDHKNEK